MGSHQKRAKSLRTSIRRHTTESLLNHLFAHLHKKQSDRMEIIKQWPWVAHFLIDQVLRCDPRKGATEATDKDFVRLMNKAWDACDISASPFLSIRAMMISQLAYQIAEAHQQRAILRLYYLTCEFSNTPYFKKQFKKFTGENLEDMFVFLLVLSAFAKHKTYWTYSEIVKAFFPRIMSLETISRLLNIAGGTLARHQQVVREQYPVNGLFTSTEYHREPIMIERPLVILDDKIVTAHPAILIQGLADLLVRKFKREDANQFKNKFTRVFEDYLHKLLKHQGIRYHSEQVLKEAYVKHGFTHGYKQVDMYIREKEQTVLIDAKGLEPNSLFLAASTEREFRDKLGKKIPKGINQVALCAQVLDQIESLKPLPVEHRFALLITHQDFFLSDGSQLIDWLGEYGDDLRSKFEGELLPENTHFCSVAQFESILECVEEAETSIGHFLRYCSENNSDSHTSKFEMYQHITGYQKAHGGEGGIPMRTEVVKAGIQPLRDRVTKGVRQNVASWVKVPEENLMRAGKALKMMVLNQAH